MGSFVFELPTVRFWTQILFEDTEGLPSVFFLPFRRLYHVACKETSCFSKSTRNCKVCPLFERCLYALIFRRRTKSIEDITDEDIKYYFPGLGLTETLPKAVEVPRPFAITVFRPRDGKKFGKLGITLVGSAIPLFHSAVETIRSAGRIGLGPNKQKFTVEHIYDHFGKNVLFEGDKLLPPEMHRFFGPRGKFGYLELKIKTPICIKRNGQVIQPEDFSFRIFVSAILSRVLPLIRFYGGSVNIEDVDMLSQMSESVSIVKNNLEMFKVKSLDDEKAKLEGLVGSATFEGEVLQYFYGLIRLGEALQIGKFTTFGFGCYSFRVL